MKINNIQNQYLNTNLYKSNNKNKPSEKEIGSKSSVNIEISNSAKELVHKIKQSNDAGISEKVEKIRQSILDGSYKVNSEEIADKIINAMKTQKDSDK